MCVYSSCSLCRAIRSFLSIDHQPTPLRPACHPERSRRTRGYGGQEEIVFLHLIFPSINDLKPMWRTRLPKGGLVDPPPVDRPACRQAGAHSSIMYTVYVLNSKKRTYLYVGLTNNISRRINQHQSGRVKTTSPYRPFQLVYSESFSTRQEARDREKYLKSGCGKEWLKEHLSR